MGAKIFQNDLKIKNKSLNIPMVCWTGLRSAMVFIRLKPMSKELANQDAAQDYLKESTILSVNHILHLFIVLVISATQSLGSGSP